MALRGTAICVLTLVAIAGCGGGGSKSSDSDVCSQFGSAPAARTTKAPWPAPDNAMALTCKAGLVPEKAEFLQYHVHAHLDVFVDGQPVVVPAGIGININDPAVHVFPNSDGTKGYGGIDPPCAKPCISPLHTHDPDGILHTESKTPTPNKLGQFFTEWGVRLTGNCVGEFCRPKVPITIYGNGDEYGGDPNEIELSNFKEIAIVIGSKPDSIPSEFPQ
jgi:hypothetical protein